MAHVTHEQRFAQWGWGGGGGGGAPRSVAVLRVRLLLQDPRLALPPAKATECAFALLSGARGGVLVTTFDPRATDGFDVGSELVGRLRMSVTAVSATVSHLSMPALPELLAGADLGVRWRETACRGRSPRAPPAPPLLPPTAAAALQQAAGRALASCLAAAALDIPGLRENLPGASLEHCAVLACSPRLGAGTGQAACLLRELRQRDMAVVGGTARRGVAALLEAQLCGCVLPPAEGGAARDAEVRAFVGDLLRVLHHRTTATPLNAALRSLAACVGPAWTYNAAFAGVYVPEAEQRLSIVEAAAAAEQARSEALQAPLALPGWWTPAVAGALALIAVLWVYSGPLLLRVVAVLCSGRL